MAVATGAAILGAAVIGAGAAMWSASRGGPETGSAPPPSNYYEYDADGNLTREQVWSSSQNGYVSKVYKTSEEKAEAAKVKGVRDQFLQNLSSAPADRVKAYDEYAANFSKQMHKDVDEQFQKTTDATEERLAGRGMLGSKAYADTISELNSEKLEVDTDIAEKSALAKETLASNDKAFWLQGVTALDSGIRADQALETQRAQNAANIANQGTAATMGGYYAQNNANYQKWLAQQAGVRDVTNTATGLAFLYGYAGKGGGASSAAKGAASTRVGNFDFGIG